VFGCVVVVAFQIAFRAEIHANDFFYFLKIIFDISTSKRSKKYKPHSILAKKILKFGEKQVELQSQTGFSSVNVRFIKLNFIYLLIFLKKFNLFFFCFFIF
jgi:hypothetical protein